MKLIVVFLSFVVATAFAQPVELVIYSSPGNQSDTAARFFAPSIEKALNRPLVIVNKPGASGTIGMRYAADTAKEKDLVLVGNANIGLASLTKKLDFDPKAQFVPLQGMSFGYAAVYVSGKSSITTAKDIVDLYKKNGRVLVGSTGQIDDITSLHLGRSLGVQIEIVRYKKATQMATELVDNRIDLTVATLGASAYQSFADSGLLRAVAVIDDTRSPYMPNIPTLKEQGYAKVEGFRWTAFFVSVGMPEDKRAVFAKAISDAMNSPEAAAYEQLPGLPQRYLKTGADIIAVQNTESAVMAAELSVLAK